MNIFHKLDSRELRRRLVRIDEQRAALVVLLRAALAQDRKRFKAPRKGARHAR